MGGMFLEYLLDTAQKCAEREFIGTFLWVAIAHFCSLVIKDMGDYAETAAAIDGKRTRLERLVQLALPYLLHLLRLVQFPLLALLTCEVSKLLVEEMNGGLVHDEEEALAKGLDFCESNEVHIAVVTVAFQFIYGFLILTSWTVCWAIAREGGEECRRRRSGGRRRLRGAGAPGVS